MTKPEIAKQTFEGHMTLLGFLANIRLDPAQMYKLGISRDGEIVLAWIKDLSTIQRTGKKVIMQPELDTKYKYISAVHLNTKGEGIVIIEGDPALEQIHDFYAVASILKIWMREHGAGEVFFATNIIQARIWYTHVSNLIEDKTAYQEIEPTYFSPRITPEGGLIFVRDDGANEIYYLAPEYADSELLDMSKAVCIHQVEGSDFIIGLSRVTKQNQVVVSTDESQIILDITTAPENGTAQIIETQKKTYQGTYIGAVPGWEFDAWVHSHAGTGGRFQSQVIFAQLPR